MTTRAAGFLAFLMLAILVCQGIVIPECRDCHVGKLSQTAVPEKDSDCDHCEHLHGNPFGCSHRQAADSEVRRVAVPSATATVASVLPALSGIPHAGPGLPPPAPVRPATCVAALLTCGVLRC
ncbi:MAG: hypothetical protein IT452_18890 [Planctomycetia bacterium]|nr:hypothetical protein [Planctomycetia bacterium]